MTKHNIKELKKDIVIYDIKTSGIEVEFTCDNFYRIENLICDNDMIIYANQTFMCNGENDTQCYVILYDNIIDFLKASCKDIIKKINEASYYNTIEVEF